MNRNEKNTEKIKMFANSLVQKCADNGIKAVAVVSSELDCGYLSSLMEKVKAFLAEKGEKLTLISFDESSINDLSELEKALESGSDCNDILQQIAAIRGAVSGLMTEVIEGHIREHLANDEITPEKRSKDVEQVIKTLKSYLK